MPNSEDFIDDLILQGALEVSGIDSDTGEMLFTFTDKLAEIDPDLYLKMVSSFRNDIMSLWEKGFLDMNVTDLNPLVSVSKKVFEKDSLDQLSENERTTLKDIMNKMSH
jgi:hypothetical protein